MIIVIAMAGHSGQIMPLYFEKRCAVKKNCIEELERTKINSSEPLIRLIVETLIRNSGVLLFQSLCCKQPCLGGLQSCNLLLGQ